MQQRLFDTKQGAMLCPCCSVSKPALHADEKRTGKLPLASGYSWPQGAASNASQQATFADDARTFHDLEDRTLGQGAVVHVVGERHFNLHENVRLHGTRRPAHYDNSKMVAAVYSKVRAVAARVIQQNCVSPALLRRAEAKLDYSADYVLHYLSHCWKVNPTRRVAFSTIANAT